MWGGEEAGREPGADGAAGRGEARRGPGREGCANILTLQRPGRSRATQLVIYISIKRIVCLSLSVCLDAFAQFQR